MKLEVTAKIRSFDDENNIPDQFFEPTLSVTINEDGMTINEDGKPCKSISMNHDELGKILSLIEQFHEFFDVILEKK